MSTITGRDGVIDTFHTTDAQRALAEASAMGMRHGHAAGSWIIDGNTTPWTAKRIIQGFEDGDPAIMDMQPNALDGQWADSITPQALGKWFPDADEADLADAYEAAYAEEWWSTVLNDARAVLVV